MSEEEEEEAKIGDVFCYAVDFDNDDEIEMKTKHTKPFDKKIKQLFQQNTNIVTIMCVCVC